MKKVIVLVMGMAMMSALLGGCYSKSCDSGCPPVKYYGN